MKSLLAFAAITAFMTSLAFATTQRNAEDQSAGVNDENANLNLSENQDQLSFSGVKDFFGSLLGRGGKKASDTFCQDLLKLKPTKKDFFSAEKGGVPSEFLKNQGKDVSTALICYE